MNKIEEKRPSFIANIKEFHMIKYKIFCLEFMSHHFCRGSGIFNFLVLFDSLDNADAYFI